MVLKNHIFVREEEEREDSDTNKNKIGLHKNRPKATVDIRQSDYVSTVNTNACSRRKYKHYYTVQAPLNAVCMSRNFEF